MKNIFSQTKDYVKQPKRNVFDLSFHNHGTFNFGYLYPVFCKETLPGDSFKIDPTFALRFLPTAFPVQTRVTANLHFFYVRNRNLWNGWKKFITHTDEVEFPYLDGSQESLQTSGLADYLGVPTTLVGNYAQTTKVPLSALSYYNGSGDTRFVSKFTSSDFDLSLDFSKLFNGQSIISMLSNPGSLSAVASKVLVLSPISERYFLRFCPVSMTLPFSSVSEGGSQLSTVVSLIFCSYGGNASSYPFMTVQITGVSDGSSVRFDLDTSLDYYFRDDLVNPRKYSSISELISDVNSFCPDGLQVVFYQPKDVSGIIPLRFSESQLSDEISYVGAQSSGFSDLSSLPPTSNPFIVSNNSSVRLSALPFRAYESIYNAFYRNDQNDPLMIDGKPEYDVYVPNLESGSDNYPYKLYRRNWELDFLTSAVQSPQQGIAPLVGVSQAGDFTFVNKDSNGNIGYFTAKANLSSDGSQITGFQLSDTVELDGLPTNPAESSNVPDSVKRGTVYSLNQMALAGISINDFRNVNSLQRWLETNIRRGYKYRDQIKSHYGVDIQESILDMPEFIGGVSSPVFSSQVNQTVETAEDPLGSYAGQLSLITDSPHSIKHYCDEHGFIIGILSITPVPNYSQLLPKHFLKYNYLDYYFPEFAHIGMQPIDYREVCPLQVYGVNPADLNKTFGYQRPWYDYIASVDEVHGLFRTNLRNFVLNRQFDTLPQLNADFLQVDPGQLNDIFTVQDVSDKILGQIKFNVIAKRPIPKFGIPRLE